MAPVVGERVTFPLNFVFTLKYRAQANEYSKCSIFPERDYIEDETAVRKMRWQ